MEEIYKYVIGSERGAKMVIAGPPGTGKTTTLFWLYQQFKTFTNYEVMAVPIQGASALTADKFKKQLILMTEIVSPSTLKRQDIEGLWVMPTSTAL